VSGNGFPPFTNVVLNLEQLTLRSYTNPGFVYVNATDILALQVKHVLCNTQGGGVTTPSNAAGACFLLPEITNQAQNQLDDTMAGGYGTGYRLTEHTEAGSIYAARDINGFVFDNGTNSGQPGTYNGNSVSVDYLWCEQCTNGMVGASNVTTVNIQNADMELSTAFDILDASNNLHGIINCLSPYTPHICSVSGATSVEVNQLYIQRSLPSSPQLIYSPSGVATNTPGVSYFASGTGGANSNCLSFLGGGGTIPSYICNIAGLQMANTSNTYYNGSNWVYVAASSQPAGAFRLLSNAGSVGAFQLSLCPAAIGTSAAAMDTSCVTQWSQYGASGNQTWFNSRAGSVTFPANAALVANPSANWMVDFSGNQTATSLIPSLIYSAAGTALPTCAVGIKGETAVVGDATAPTYMGAYTSGGGITAAVICSFNGTTFSWLSH
jgi:hypothetical protein